MICLVIALLQFITGLILEVIAKKHSQLYELYLNSIRRRDKNEVRKNK